MKKKIFAFLLAVMPLSSAVQAEFMLNTLTSFGGGDGWLAPAEVIGAGPSVLTADANRLQRGMSYFGPRNEVYVVDRNGGAFVRVLNGDTGETLRTLSNNIPPTPSIISGGIFAVNMIATGSDGAIYVANLATQVGSSSNLRIYRWADSTAGTTPTLAFNSLLTGSNWTNANARAGDSFAVFGGGSTARLAVSGSGSTGVGLLDTTDGGVTFTQTASALTGAASGGLRLGLDFVSADAVIGKQPGAGNNFAVAPLGTTATASSFAATNISEAALAFDPTNSLLATIETGTSRIRLYTGSNPSAVAGATLGTLQFANTTLGGTSGFYNNTSGTLFANTDGTGDLAFGTDPNGVLRLYAMNTNQGIQAFTVTAVPEPSSIALVTLGVVGVVARRRQLAGRKQVS